jgi:hypothetical protein
MTSELILKMSSVCCIKLMFDIYGQHLRPGYCEVHPDIPEEYPCSLCVIQDEGDAEAYRQYEECMAQEAEEYYREELEQYTWDCWFGRT